MNRRAHFLRKWRTPTARLVSSISLLVLSAVQVPVWAVDCNPMSMALHTQAEVDNFQATYGPCDRVLTLYIQEGADISNVDGLSALTSVTISLYIQDNPLLTNLDGLSSLTVVGGNLWIQNNTLLADMNGLASLTDVGEKLVVFANGALTNVAGLSSLHSVGDTLSFWDNPVLTDVDGLSSLVSIGGSDRAEQGFLVIRNNAALANLDGLSSLTSIGSYHVLSGLIITDNPQLESIAGLHSLEDIWGSMIITGNDSLTAIDVLPALSRVIEIFIQDNASLASLDGLPAVTNTSSLKISGNGMLNNLDGLSGMQTIWNDLTIQDNSNLSDCSGLLRLVDQWDDADLGPGTGSVPDVGGEVSIGGNQAGCNTIAEILAGLDISRINPGLNDAWYNPDTSGQGFFITVFPDLGAASLAWFTYDTELPPADASANLGDPGHRWLTAVGPIVGNQVYMDIEMTSGGLFDTATEISRTDPPGSDGTIVLTFTSCNSGTVEYDIPSIDRHGVVPVRRVANDNIGLCETLSLD